jgi:VanZ family protein
MQNKYQQYFITFVPAFFWALLIYIFSSQQVLPSLSLSVADFIFKKTAHIVVYAILYFLIVRSFLKLNFKFEKIWLKVFFICLTYAIFDEIHQSTVPGRTATVTDVGFDSLGAGMVILYKFGLI